MRITDVQAARYGELRPTMDVYAGREVLVVTVRTDAGATGTGFTTMNVPAHGPVGDWAAGLIGRTFRSLLLGEDPLAHLHLWHKLYDAVWRLGRRGLVLQCLGALDCALWDLKARLLGVPLSVLLGGRRERVLTYATAAHQLPPERLAEKAASYVAAGHRAVKIRGSATAVSLREATERVRQVRAAVGPEVKLMVDVNGTWDTDTAIEQLKRWEPYDVYWLEEPVPPEDIPGYVRVRKRAGRTLIAGGEQHATVAEFRELLRQEAVDVVQPNVNVTGGITEWLRVHALAHAMSVPVSPWDLHLVHVHLAAALPGVKWVEYFAPDTNDLVHRLFRGPALAQELGDDGVYLVPPQAPGLGLELDPEAAERLIIRE